MSIALNTEYIGLSLKNPLIAGSSSLTGDLDSIRRLEDSGVAALVTKSLFEEEIQLERFKFAEDQEKDNYRHPEMITIFPELDFKGVEEHMMWVQKACSSVEIPVIGSLNAVTHKTWIEYAAPFEQTGIAALECNLFSTPYDPARSGSEIENSQVELVRELRRRLSIPLIIKLSSFYTSPTNIIMRLAEAGADSVVLFNRFFQPDIDIQHEQLTYPLNLSNATDYRLSLRYTALLANRIDADICAASGIYSGRIMAKLLLAGASAVQVVSALYRHGSDHVGTMLSELTEWMEARGYQNINEFKGKMAKEKTAELGAYTRAQYGHLLLSPNLVINNRPDV